MVPPSDHPLVECIEALHYVVVSVFGKILDPVFENYISAFKEKFMGAMRTHNLIMALNMCSSIRYQNMGAVQEFDSGLPLSRRWRVSIDLLIFSATDSK